MMQGTLVEREGKLYVRYSCTEYAEPFENVHYWLVTATKGNPYSADRPGAGDDATYRGTGSWHTSNAARSSTGSVSTGAGDTQAAFRERNEVPAPPARGKELRWNNGCWERLLKKGWVPA